MRVFFHREGGGLPISYFRQGCSTQHKYQGKLNCRYNISTDVSLLPAMLRQASSAQVNLLTCDLHGLLLWSPSCHRCVCVCDSLCACLSHVFLSNG